MIKRVQPTGGQDLTEQGLKRARELTRKAQARLKAGEIEQVLELLDRSDAILSKLFIRMTGAQRRRGSPRGST